MDELPTIETLQNDAQLKSLTAALRESSDMRLQWGQNEHLWRTVVQALETGDHTAGVSTAMLQFLNNLTASSGIGNYAVAAGFPTCFVRNAHCSDTTARRLYWQILANLLASFSGQGSPALSNTIEEICPALPLADAIASGRNAVTYPCLVFLWMANNLIVSASLKKKLNISSGAFEAILDALQEWFEGGDEKNGCIKVAKDIFQSCLITGFFVDVMSEFQKGDAREVILYSIIDAVVASPSFQEVPESMSRFVHTESGRTDLAAICTRLEESVDTVTTLISDDYRTEELSVISNQRTLKLVDILITLLSSVSTSERQEQRYLIPSLVKLLVESKKIPAISKLGNARSFDELPIDDRNFPHLRTYALMLLAVLVEDDFASQEEARTSGGLAAVLECCVIDANNPFMKERAIVCLRFLLKNNDENQKFVASLEARQVADPDALAQAGYEASIKHGKISLKQT